MAKVNMMSLQEEPRTGQLLTGYGPYGNAKYITVTLEPHQDICARCEGTGTVTYDYGVDGFQKLCDADCEDCNGHGTIINQPEERDE